LDFKGVKETIIKFLGVVDSRDQWEVKINYLIVLAKTMRKLIESDEYQKFGKKQNPNNGGGRNTNAGDGDDAVLKEIREIFQKISTCF